MAQSAAEQLWGTVILCVASDPGN
ncbi:hypothetical protein E2C01_099610 [Portunus trituberculatus]|uniref:Uncharacterized protein n=1 Tax=Portunus trituberculatus TaxID=210409 RepID=A0A5B7KFS9_PORTR|nr:hypothetical protein [Portunus trituberculatus]